MSAWWLAGLVVSGALLPLSANAQSSGSAWVSDGKPTPLAVQAVSRLQAASEDGLSPDDYLAPELASELVSLQHSGQPDIKAVTLFEQRLNLAMTQYLNDLALGRVSARDVHHRFDGAEPRQFSASLELQSAIDAGNLDLAIEQARPTFPLYPALKVALSQYQTLAGHSAWQTALPMPTGKKLEESQPYSGLDMLRERLIVLGDMPSPVAPSKLYDSALVQGVKAFQARHGLTQDGVIGPRTLDALNVTPAQRAEQIALSMERLRWTPLHQGERLIAVNLPGFMLYGFEIDDAGKVRVDVEMRVVVGRSLNHRTPVFDEDMRFIEFSPYWNVPPSIARSETIPALRKDPNYLQKQQMEFVDASGKISTDVTPEKLQAVLKGQIRIRQRPGPHNALGSIKFIFPNNENIFLHFTPSTHLFERDRRDLSHGCIRVEEPVELAKFVLANDPEWTEEKIREAMDAGTSKTIRLKDPVPVLIGYSTVLTRNGTVFFYPDVYGHDATLLKALSKYKGLQ